MPSGPKSKVSARVRANVSQGPRPGHATRSAASASGPRNSRSMALAGAATSPAAARGRRPAGASLTHRSSAAGAAPTTATPSPQAAGPLAPVATRASRAAQQSAAPVAAQCSQPAVQALVANAAAHSSPPANLPAAVAYVPEQYVRGSRSARGRSPPSHEPQSPPADTSCDQAASPPRRSPRSHGKHRSDRASSGSKRKRNYSPSSDSDSYTDTSESSFSSSSDNSQSPPSRKRAHKQGKGHKRRRSRSNSLSSSPEPRSKHRRGYPTLPRRVDQSASAHVSSNPTGGNAQSLLRPQQSEPAAATKPKRHYIPKIAKYLRRYPKHFDAMALFRDWPNSQKAEAIRDFSKSSGKQTEAVEDLEEALYEGSRGQPAFAFDVVLNYLSAHESRVQIHGGRLALGARYAGQNFTPARGHRSALKVIGEEILQSWNAVLPHMLASDTEIPGSTMSGLLDAVKSYFEERADFARGDFGRHKVLKCIARKTRDQSNQVCELLKAYESYFAKGLRKGQLSRSAVNHGWFHLLYEFCKDFGDVPEVTFKVTKSSVASRLPQPAAAYYQQHHSLSQTPYQQQYQQYSAHPLPVASQPQQHMAALPPPPPPPPLPQQRPSSGIGFLGRPMSAAVVGPGLATIQPPNKNCRRCSGGHYAFECPVAYFLKFNEPCPGFDAQGNVDHNAWAAGDITGQTKAAWRAYLARHRIAAATQGIAAGRQAVDFS